MTDAVDREHDATLLGAAEFSRDERIEPAGDYETCIAALRQA